MRIKASLLAIGVACSSWSQSDTEVTGTTNACAASLYSPYNPKNLKQCRQCLHKVRSRRQYDLFNIVHDEGSDLD